MAAQLYNLFKDAAAKNPGADCLIMARSGETLSYKQVDVLTQSYMQHFRSAGVLPGQRVGVLLAKSPEAIAAVLALNALQVVYVPLDTESPTGRLHTIIAECEISAIVSVNEILEKLLPENRVVSMAEGNLSLALINNEYSPCDPEQAYILNTSGSTGKPKPVLISNTAALSFVHWAVDFLSLENGLTFSSIAPLHFDLSVFDIYAAFKTAGTICLFTAEDARNPLLLSESIPDYAIEVIYATPTIYQLIVNFGKPLRYDHSSLAHVIYAGEPFPITALAGLMELWKEASFYNFYGPTETNVCTAFAIPDVIAGYENIPIGKSCSHCRTRLLETEHGTELLVAGQSLFTGYYNNATDTEKKIIHDDEGAWYRTGDIVTLDEEGNYLYAGRTDRMIKRKGYRIEPGEIENTLSGLEGINQVAVVRGSVADETRMGLFYTGMEKSEQEWKAECMRRLPSYMIPDNFIHLEEWPLTSGGKTDIIALTLKYESHMQ